MAAHSRGAARAGRACSICLTLPGTQGGPELIDSLYYSANVYAARAISKIEALPPTSPLYIHLTWQNVHGPCERHVSTARFGRLLLR